MSKVIDNIILRDDLFFIEKLIERNGYRLTDQRKLILEYFFVSNKHLRVEDIYKELRHENVSLATVYRTVKIFNDIGILKEIIVDGASYYELKIFSQKPLHIHFQCVRCNDIIDVEEREVALKYLELNKAIEDINDLEIYDVDIMFVGLCKECREVNKWQGQ